MKTFPAILFTTFLVLPSLLAQPKIFDAFESDGFGQWQLTGTAFGLAPTSSKPPGMNGEPVNFANSYYVSSAHGGDVAQGKLQSQRTKIEKKFLSFLICGGNHKGKTAVQLLVNYKPVMEATGQNDLVFRPVTWDLTPYQGAGSPHRHHRSRTRGLGHHQCRPLCLP